MPTLVRTLTKSNTSDPWIIPTKNSASASFTQDEIDTKLTPAWNYIVNFEGFIANSYSEIYNGNTVAFSMQFNTTDNIANFLQSTLVDPTDPAIIASNNLVSNKRMSANVSYTPTTSII